MDVIPYIEGDPFINTVPVDPGLTNTESERNGTRVTGLNSENQELHEGLIRFDIVFYVRMKDGLSQMIINVEAQKGIKIPVINTLITGIFMHNHRHTKHTDILRIL